MRIVVSYRGIPESPGWATGDCMVRALRRLGHEVFAYGNYYQTTTRIQPGMPPSDPDLLLWMECNDRDPQYTELLDWKCPKVLWDFDTAMHEGFTRDLASHFDHVFLANPRYLDIPRSHYLPYAFDPGLMRRTPQKEYPERHLGPDCRDGQLEEHYTGATITINNIDRHGAAIIGSPFTQRADFARAVGLPVTSNVFRQEYVDTVAGLRVHIHNHASGGSDLLVMRIWETLGLGTCLLTEDSDTLRRHFAPGTHCIVYRDAEDCRRQLGRLLDREDWREHVAAAGQAEVLAHHTYLNRAQELLATL